MKTTIDISKSLFEEAWRLADHKRMTFKEVIEVALRRLLKTEKVSRKPFKLRWHTFRGKGMVEGLSEGDWPEIRRLIYEGRGG